MKKLIFIAAGSLFVLASCKKDHTCSCKNSIKVNDASGKEIFYASATDEHTVVNATQRTAYNHCAHTEWKDTDASGNTTTTDIYCELK